MNNKVYIKIPAPGGFIAVGDLRSIAVTAMQFGCRFIHLSNRQDILLQIEKRHVLPFTRQLKSLNPCPTSNQHCYPNIMSLYPAIDIARVKSWVSEGLIHEILEKFDYEPELKINVSDAEQGLVPLFTGNLNFIASDYDNYWYLFISHRALGERIKMPYLVYGDDIPGIAKTLENKILKSRGFIEQNHLHICFDEGFRCMNLEEPDYPFQKPDTNIGWYEGWQRTGKRYRLGIYQRKNYFDARFIESLCIKCSEANIGSVSITPWQSLIIKNINEKYYEPWNQMMGSFGVSTMHSALEKNWQVPELDEDAQRLKDYLYFKLDRHNVRTEGLIFGLKTSPMDLASSVVIEEHQFHPVLRNTGILDRYTIKYVSDFDPNKEADKIFAKKIKKKDLIHKLLELCSYYHKGDYLKSKQDNSRKTASTGKQESPLFKWVYQCGACLTVYDPEYGEPEKNIPAGTLFENIQKDFTCPLCDSGKDTFKPVEKAKLNIKI